ncbi:MULTISPECIES: hemolysin family protein [Haloferax]|uniref:CBS domain-containing protein n=2 Tax=Haloferax gibbonsii TaxID=35746 RepID=A0A0K1IRN7_HALGI|nr:MULTISPECIES: hemolysin family protein [Haloferax]AKU07094.1 CBS domain-containing protein [Haloferax gibbonsii]ELZ76413.1 inosine monophosphate dehydrogenase [Haloferax gibbonsii ATCC 33959]REA05408.1 HlyC/CorC family transporter [Haloferax sp. Atlit-6N]
MVGVETALRLGGGLVLLLANAFFVVSEFAMTRVPQFDESAFEGSRGLELAWEMTERLEVYLSGCQVGITIASVGLGVVAEPAVAATFDAVLGGGGSAGSHTSLSVGLALVVINLSHVVLGEQVPTYLGVERSRTVAKYTAPVLYGWTKLMYPVIVVADWLAKRLLSLVGVEITRSWQEAEIDEEEDGDGSAGEGPRLSRGEVRSQMGDILAQGSLPEDRREEVLNALRIGELPVRDVMVPADRVVALSVDASTDESLERIRANPQHSRFPLVGDSLDDVRGVVYAPTVLSNIDRLQSGDRRLEDIAAPPLSVLSDLSVSDLIDRFQAENQELAMVRDPEGGSVVGLVTASDAFESITGQLYDPLDLGA